MDILFEIKDKKGKIVYLSRERWKHTVSEHPTLSNSLEKIKETILSPLTIKSSIYDKNLKLYFRYYKERGEYLMVIAKYLNGYAFIITSYYVRNIKNEK